MVPVPPFQHSPMLGHCASSQTVCSLSSESDVCSSANRVCSPPGAGTRNQSGRDAGIAPPTRGTTAAAASWVPAALSSTAARCAPVDHTRAPVIELPARIGSGRSGESGRD
eukprot:scaffold18687_cov118-Isochrysis_galbana.AAC.6